MMYEGLRDHYGIEVENFKVHAYAEADHGDAADYLLRQVAIDRRAAAPHPHRDRAHVHPPQRPHVALNRWLDEPGALRVATPSEPNVGAPWPL